jgi:hypothetical protein
MVFLWWLASWVSVCLSVCVSVWQSVCLSVSLSVCLSVRLPACPSLRLPVCPSVCLSVCPSVRLFRFLSCVSVLFRVVCRVVCLFLFRGACLSLFVGAPFLFVCCLFGVGGWSVCLLGPGSAWRGCFSVLVPGVLACWSLGAAWGWSGFGFLMGSTYAWLQSAALPIFL